MAPFDSTTCSSSHDWLCHFLKVPPVKTIVIERLCSCTCCLYLIWRTRSETLFSKWFGNLNIVRQRCCKGIVGTRSSGWQDISFHLKDLDAVGNSLYSLVEDDDADGQEGSKSSIMALNGQPMDCNRGQQI